MALIPPSFLDAVTAIGVGDDPAKRQWIGTGFLFGRFEKAVDTTTSSFTVFLITNKHVLKGLKRIYLKFNSAQDGTSKDYAASLVARNGRPYWAGHPNSDVDVVALPVNANHLQGELRKYAYFRSDAHVFSTEQLKESGVTEGDGVFVLGFPMGMVATDRQYVVCRTGAIARIRDWMEGKAQDFLVDATVFPGNSGGPVIIRPELVSIQGTKAVGRASLIGIVKSYVPYQDFAVSQQTNRPRIIFEENSGLASVEPVDHILETVELARRRMRGRNAWARWKARKTQPGPQPNISADSSGAS